jgi:hypothetical protein
MKVVVLLLITLTSCMRIEVVSEPVIKTIDTTSTLSVVDTVSVKIADTIDKRQPIGFTVTVKDWEYVDN